MSCGVLQILRPFGRRSGRGGRSCLRAEGGNAAVEFAIIAPVFVLILAATVQIASAIHARFDLNAQMSAAVNYALVNGGSIDTVGAAEEFAEDLADLLASAARVREVYVNVNKVAIAELMANGIRVTVNSNHDPNACYCPTADGEEIDWDNTGACQVSCNGESLAGRFVEMWASAPHLGLFGDLLSGGGGSPGSDDPSSGGTSNGGDITVRALVPLQ